jgi:MFS family permease
VEGAIKADVFKRKIRARVLGKLEAAVPTGRLLAAIIGFAVLSVLPIATGFYIAAAALFVAFLIFQLFFRERRPEAKIEKFRFKFQLQKYPRVFNVWS